MPGRNAQEAVDAFLEPLREAVSVLDGFAQFLISPKRGGYRKGETYGWTLCGAGGMFLKGLGSLHAQMWFEIVDADPEKYEKPVRVTTRGYRYRLEAIGGGDKWRAHWHPNGKSDATFPHVHMPPDYAHFMLPRVTFENVVQWCVQLGAPLRCTTQEAEARLTLAQAPHLLFRTWNTHPDEPHG